MEDFDFQLVFFYCIVNKFSLFNAKIWMFWKQGNKFRLNIKKRHALSFFEECFYTFVNFLKYIL